MATVESLDLASLQNNPQSIAEALEDALETTDGTIGTLKTNAQSKKDDIDDLYDDALTAKNNIDDLLTDADHTEDYYTNTFDNNWEASNLSDPPTDEHGLRMQRYGKIYIVHLSVYKTNQSTSHNLFQTIKTLTSSDITLPTNDVIMGISHLGKSTQDDVVGRLLFKSNGEIVLYYRNFSGSTFNAIANFIGVDL